MRRTLLPPLRHLYAQALVVLILALLSGRSSAQWVDRTSPVGNQYGAALYFLDPDTGFCYLQSITVAGYQIQSRAFSTGVWKTTDGAKTWSAIPDLATNYTSQMCFVSEKIGYASITGGPGAIRKTTDRGATWKTLTTPDNGYSSIYATERALAATAYQSPYLGDLVVSHDGGATWITVDIEPGSASGNLVYCNVTGNKDHNIYAIGSDAYYDIFLVYSTDDGYTWKYTSLDVRYGGVSEQIFSVPHSSRLIRQHMDAYDRQHDTYSFFTAVAPYSSWKNSLQQTETGGWVYGTPCAQYLPNAYNSTGLYRSVNLGANWKLVGGPDCTEIDDYDWHNIAVVGYGAIVYGMPLSRGIPVINMTVNGGDGTLSAAALKPQLRLDPSWQNQSVEISPCDSTQLAVAVRSLSCSIARIKHVHIPGIADSLYRYRIVEHLAEDNAPDSILITLAPQSIPPTTELDVTLEDDEYVMYDESLPLSFTPRLSNAIALDLNTPVLTLVSGRDVDVPLYARSLGPSISTTALGATFRVRHDLFTPLSFVPTWRGVTSHTEIFGGDSAHVDLVVDPSVILSSSVQVGYLHCSARLTDSNETIITMQNSTATAADGSCVVVIGEDSSTATANMLCGEAEIEKLLRGQPITLRIQRASVDASGHALHVTLGERRTDVYAYVVYSITGDREIEGHWTGSEGKIDVSRVPSGPYVLRVERAGSPQSASTMNFVVEH